MTQVIKSTAVYVVRAGFCNDVDHAPSCAAILSVRTGGHDLKLFDGVHRDVDGSALAAGLFTEKAVVIVAAVEAYVVKDAALPGEIDLVTVGALRNAHPRRQGQQVLKFSAKDGRVAD